MWTITIFTSFRHALSTSTIRKGKFFNKLSGEIEMKCMKCQRETDKALIRTIRLSTGSFYLCLSCYEKWEKIYIKFRQKGKINYWEEGWKEFMKLEIDFNPSHR
jgi:hypothetical protein